jgi:Holliday junction resolvasome RuvABC endonuclease subunit
MIIIGADLSINSSGMVRLILDDKTLEIKRQDYLSFTQVKKTATSEIIHYKKERFKNNIEQNKWMTERIISFCITLGEPEYIGIEDYAFAAQGLVFNIAEFIGGFKSAVYDRGWKIRLYDPCTIKMYATGKGNADKVAIEDAFTKNHTGTFPTIDSLPEYKSPKIDIIDAYFIAKILQVELKIRHNVIDIRKLSEMETKIFQRTTKGNPENLLVREFLAK